MHLGLLVDAIPVQSKMTAIFTALHLKVRSASSKAELKKKIPVSFFEFSVGTKFGPILAISFFELAERTLNWRAVKGHEQSYLHFGLQQNNSNFLSLGY